MCNSRFQRTLVGAELAGEVHKVVRGFVDGGVSFTKYDVTKKVRDNVSDDLEVLHSDVRTEVEALMANEPTYLGEFDRSIGAFRYSEIASTVHGPATPVQPAVAIASNGQGGFNKAFQRAASSIKNFAQAIGVIKPDLTATVAANKKGLCLPKRVVAEAAKNSLHGHKVYIEVEAQSPNSVSQALVYQPDQYGNTTVGRNILSRVYGTAQPGDKYNVEVRLGTIRVTRP